MTALPASAWPEGDAKPVPWRRMAWITWRQHRTALAGVAAFLGAVAVGMWLAGLQVHHAYAAATACHPAASIACSDLASSFNHMALPLFNGYPLQAVPALIGAFAGAPLLARELETGTIRYAWTQAFGRSRWSLAKLVPLAVAVTAGAGALTVLLSWYYQPYLAARNFALSLNEVSPLSATLFDLRGVDFAAWTLAAFAIGVLAGVLTRRVIPAVAATLAAYGALATVTGLYLREHYLTPLVTSNSSVHVPAWILSRHWTKGGHPVSQSVMGQVFQREASRLAGGGRLPRGVNMIPYVTRHGYTQWTTYQPASRFWPFQWIESGWLLALSVLLIGVTVWLLRRRAT